jgi:hypothetical protein
MKPVLILVAALLLFAQVNAQKPEPVYSNARVHKPIDWYKQQAAAWKKVTEAEPGNAMAWYYYYYANRNLQYRDTDDKRTHEEKQAAMAQLLSAMEKGIPDSYEYNLVKWMNGGFDMKLIPYLERAVRLGEGRTEHLDFLVNIAELDRDIKKRDHSSLKKHEAGNLSTGMLYYNYNVIAGLDPNAILVTAGDNDTYPVWVLQAMGIRRDITVLNLSLLQIDSYRDKIFNELGIADFGRLHHDSPALVARHRFRKEIVQHIAANTKGYPVYVALSAAEGYTSEIEQDLYLTGLTYRYSKASFDNIAVMRHNFEQQYALDYIDKPYYQDISAELVQMINANYVVPMLKLFDHYKVSGDSQKQEWIRRKILAVSKGNPDEEEVKKHVALK